AWYKKYITVIFISLGVIGSITMGWLLKWCVNRPRPPEAYHIVESYGASFPSAHSVYASTLACLAMIMLCHKHNINSPYSVHDKFHRTLILSGFCEICRVQRLSRKQIYF
ncbi:phosphatase PAP2 family protein, partial [Acinetobacter baumannii]